MSEAPAKPVFLVNADSDPVVVRIAGRACFQNSTCLRDFVTVMFAQGRTRLVLDFQQCASMDSTFLGVLAGAAIELRKQGSGGSLVAARVGQRNLDLMRSLGLHRLLTITAGEPAATAAKCDTPLEPKQCSELESTQHVLEAHENLVQADAANREKFQDVVAFLRTRLEQK
jgi:anti-sigma B factor antagonist